MNVIEILVENLKEKFPLPSKGKAFHLLLKEELNEYLKEINKLKWKGITQNLENDLTFEKFIDIGSKICNNINNAIYDTRNGMPNKAYEKIKTILLTPELEKYLYDIIESKEKKFNRLREIKRAKTSISEDIVKHCPFDEVHKLGNFRFSLSGYPCLYLGSSIDVCKKEIGFKENESYYQGTFEIKGGQRIKLLNICPFDNNGKINNPLRFLLLYPLYLSCLARKQHNKGTFHEEYIIPQLLLLYIRLHNTKKRNAQEHIDGIRYLSTHYEKGKNILDMMNYVFPVTQIKDNGYDEDLMGKFEIQVELYKQ